ncbi:MAG: hypothetical protein HY982_00245 [Candidatus Magasanikbacteria bacterium]|nr:hypothetical protein [Candidatus Magasanikbacteria bacterium]
MNLDNFSKLKTLNKAIKPNNLSPIYLDLRGQNQNLEAFAGWEKPRLEKFARIIRGLMFAAIEAGQSGHPGGSSSKTEQLLTLLLSGLMAFDPLDPKNPNRDRLIWSAGHCTPLLHAAMALMYEALRRSGRQFSPAALHAVLPEDLTRFRHYDGPQGHAENYYPLSDLATGSSGHGLSGAGGLAIVHKSCGLGTKVWVLMGDAETEEGMSYEARNLLPTLGADNLIVLLDYNHYGIDGDIAEVISTPYLNHWRGFGWNVIETNGHDYFELARACQIVKKGFDNHLPIVVICHCIKGKDYGAKENTSDSHGNPAKHEEYVKIIRKLGFDIPGELGKTKADLEAILSELKDEDAEYIVQRLELGRQIMPKEADAVRKMQTALAGRPLVKPVSLRRPAVLPTELVFEQGAKVATRKATQAWFKWLMENTAFFYLGAGDLSKSILTGEAEKVYGLINQDNPLGRGIRFGIAEQNMAMFCASLSQDVLPGGYQPVAAFATYGVFTSMMSNAVRMALIGNHLKPETKGFFIMLAAHDGPETGEDGPTHQGLFWMALYNAYPGIKVYKPLDANETIEMLFYALEKGEPIALSVVRPDTPVFKRGNGVPEAKAAIDGAYVFKNYSENNGQKIVLIISGGQVLANALEILPELESNGLDVKIVAVTSPELYEELRKTNLAKAREILSDEERGGAIAIHNGWKGFLYPFLLPSDYGQRAIGIDCFLKSGKVAEVYELAGLTARDIKEKILKITLNCKMA